MASSYHNDLLWITNNFMWFINKCHNELLGTCAHSHWNASITFIPPSFTSKHVIAHKIELVILHLSESRLLDACMFFNTVIPILLLSFDLISNILKNGKIWTRKFTWIPNLHWNSFLPKHFHFSPSLWWSFLPEETPIGLN